MKLNNKKLILSIQKRVFGFGIWWYIGHFEQYGGLFYVVNCHYPIKVLWNICYITISISLNVFHFGMRVQVMYCLNATIDYHLCHLCPRMRCLRDTKHFEEQHFWTLLGWVGGYSLALGALGMYVVPIWNASFGIQYPGNQVM